MRKLRLLALSLLTLAAAGLLQSCKEDKLSSPDANEIYTRDFIKQFGVPDPSHTYNMAVQGSVTVTTASPTDYKVYAVVSGKRYLFADYQAVSGTQNITLDLPRDVKHLIVRTNGTDYTVPVGGAIDLSNPGSRTLGETVNNSDIKISYTATPKKFSQEIIKNYIGVLEEGGENLKNVRIDGKPLTSDFYFKGEGLDKVITFYPIYWYTSSYHALGIYWFDENGKFQTQDLYYTRSGELEYQSPSHIYNYPCEESGLAEGELCTKHNSILHHSDEEITLHPIDSDGNVNKISYWGQKNVNYHTWEEWADATAGGSQTYKEAFDIDEVTSIRTKGISIAVREGLKYGFYIKVDQYNSINPDRKDGDFDYKEVDEIHHMIFSEASVNRRYGNSSVENYIEDDLSCVAQNHIYNAPWSWTEGDGTSKTSYSHAVYVTIPINNKNYSFFSFEDWHNDDHPDLNDLVFVFEEGSFVPVEDVDDPDRYPEEDPDDEGGEEGGDPDTHEWHSWILAAEDLGLAVCDWDFNDMVAMVSTCQCKIGNDPSYTEVRVVPMASGGTLPIYMMWTGTPKGGSHGTYLVGTGEFHGWTKSGKGSNEALNVKAGETVVIDATTRYAEFEVEGDFSLANHLNKHYGTAGDNDETINMGGFWFVVDKNRELTALPTIGTNNFTLLGPDFKTPNNAQAIKAPTLSTETVAVPQMICVEQCWLWPHEGYPIGDITDKNGNNVSGAYAGFTTWMTDSSQDGWCHDSEGNHPEANVIRRTVITTTTGE